MAKPYIVDTKKSYTKEIEQFQKLKITKSSERQYQLDAYNSITTQLLDDDNRVAGMLVLPTGGGKTRVAVSWAVDKAINDGYKVLWIAHRHMLLEQAFETFKKFGGLCEIKDSLQIRIVSGKHSHSSSKEINFKKDDIVVASIGSLNKKLRDKFSSVKKLLVIVDEAHHSVAPTYKEWIGLIDNQKKYGWFRRKLEKNHFTKLKILGLTATPINSNNRKEEELKAIFDNEAALFKISASELMRLGILSQPILNPISTEHIVSIDADDIDGNTEKQVEDSINKQLAENADRNHFIVETYKKLYKDNGKTLIFAVNVNHAEMLQGFFKNDGFNCETIYSGKIYSTDEGYEKNTSNDTILDKFRDDESGLDILINVGILTEGSDVPSIQNVFITRIVGSETLYTQMIGRALRGVHSGGTKNANIITFEDNIKNFDILSLKDLLVDGGWQDEEIQEKSLKDVDIWNDRKYSVNEIKAILAKKEEELDDDGEVKTIFKYKMLSYENIQNQDLEDKIDEEKKCCYILAQRDLRDNSSEWNFERKEQYSFKTQVKSDINSYSDDNKQFYFITQKDPIRLPRMETRYFQKYWNDIRNNTKFKDVEILPSYGIPVGEFILLNDNDDEIDKVPVYQYQKNSYDRYFTAYLTDDLVKSINEIDIIKEKYFQEANNFIPVSNRALSNILKHLKSTNKEPEFEEYNFEIIDEANDFIENLAIRLANNEALNLNDEYNKNLFLHAVYSRKQFRDEVQAREDIIRGYEEEFGEVQEIDRKYLSLTKYKYRDEDELNTIHNLEELYLSASKMICDVLNKESLEYSPKVAQWTKKAYKSYFGMARGINMYTKKVSQNSSIDINSILCSADIPSYVIEFILYHEMLHFELKLGHTAEFKELEAKFPKYTEAESILAEVSDWINEYYDDVEENSNRVVTTSIENTWYVYDSKTYTKSQIRDIVTNQNLVLPTMEELSTIVRIDSKYYRKDGKDEPIFYLSKNMNEKYSSFKIVGKHDIKKDSYILIVKKGN